MTLRTRLVASLLLLTSPLVAGATTIVGGVSGGGGFLGISWGSGGGGGFRCAATICGIADTILYIINDILVPLLFAVSFIVFLYGIAQKYIFQPDKASDGHKLILWGVVGFVVMVSLWGIVNIVAQTFGLQGYYAPPLPTSF